MEIGCEMRLATLRRSVGGLQRFCEASLNVTNNPKALSYSISARKVHLGGISNIEAGPARRPMHSMEPTVLGRLYRQHAPALRLYARQWGGSAEDLVQEAFVRLAQQTPPPEQILPWLYRVVRNAALMALCTAAGIGCAKKDGRLELYARRRRSDRIIVA
jgi:hypothetical protein